MKAKKVTIKGALFIVSFIVLLGFIGCSDAVGLRNVQNHLEADEVMMIPVLEIVTRIVIKKTGQIVLPIIDSIA